MKNVIKKIIGVLLIINIIPALFLVKWHFSECLDGYHWYELYLLGIIYDMVIFFSIAIIGVLLFQD